MKLRIPSLWVLRPAFAPHFLYIFGIIVFAFAPRWEKQF
jgi:hypothetical protein